MASITKNKLTVVVVVAILAIMLLPSMIDSSSVTNSTTNATTNNTTIQSTTITTAITANTCSSSSYAYGISSSGILSCNQVSGTILGLSYYTLSANTPITNSGSPTSSTAVLNFTYSVKSSTSNLIISLFFGAASSSNNAVAACFISNVAGSIPTGNYVGYLQTVADDLPVSNSEQSGTGLIVFPSSLVGIGTISLSLNCFSASSGTMIYSKQISSSLVATEIVIQEIS